MRKINRPMLAVVVAAVAICMVIAWAFYQSLQLDSKTKSAERPYPQKAVMAQTQAMNKARLDRLASQGKVIRGMSTQQVRVALGEPERIDEVTQKGEILTVWWYREPGWHRVIFKRGKVLQVERP